MGMGSPRLQPAGRTRLRLLWLLALLLTPSQVPAQEEPGDLGITLPPSINFASPPSPVGSGARAEGMAGAFIGIADDATAASWNPGGLLQLERPEVSCVGALAWRRETPYAAAPGIELAAGSHLDANLNYLSLAYPLTLLGRNLVLSLNLQRLYDFQGDQEVLADFETLFGRQRIHSRQQGTLYTLTPSLAVQITPCVSVGLSVNLWKDGLPGDSWEQEVEVTGQGVGVVGPQEVPFSYQGSIHEEFGFQGINFTAGILWRAGERLAFGAVVKTPFRARLDYEHESRLQVTLADSLTRTSYIQKTLSREIHMDMPVSYGFGVSGRLADALTVDLDVSRTEWSGFEREDVTQDLPDFILVDDRTPAGKGKEVLSGEAGATNQVRLGGEYVLFLKGISLPLRLGVCYDPEPNAGSPDDFYGVSAGAGLTFDRLSFDLAYTFRTGTLRNPDSRMEVYQQRFLFSLICYL